MGLEKDYIKINKASWNNKVSIHVNSDFYDVPGFLKGKSSLNSIELDLFGNIQGKNILHLQCHFGLDSLSLSRLGAHVTGVDLSDKAIEKAKELSEGIKSNASFICCDLYDLPKHLDQKFDLVFTSYGTIGWLPDLNKWGKIISHFLKPNGKFVFVEFHPVVWMFDDHFKEIKYPYFNLEPIVETLKGTYADKNAPIQQQYIMWNHSLSDVVNSLIKNGIQIESLEEFDYSPYDCFNETEQIQPGKFRIKHLKNKIPMIYSILGIKQDF